MDSFSPKSNYILRAWGRRRLWKLISVPFIQNRAPDTGGSRWWQVTCNFDSRIDGQGRPAPFSLFGWSNRQIQSGSLGLTRRGILLWRLLWVVFWKLFISWPECWLLCQAITGSLDDYSQVVKPWPGVFPSTSVCVAYSSFFLVLWVLWHDRWLIWDHR